MSVPVDELRERWPTGPAPDERFTAYLAERPSERYADLYLAWWCSLGDAAGIAALEQLYARDLAIATSRFRAIPAEELLQQLRIKLFVGAGDQRPRILEYAGSGSLQGWLRVTAVRTFVDSIRATKQQRETRELDEGALLGIVDLEREAIGAELGAAVKQAFGDAVAQLTARQRVFLRHAYVDRHTLDQIALHYRVHRTTVARTLASAREDLMTETRARLAQAMRITGSELSSVIRALDDNVELSLSRVLAPHSRLEP